MAVLQLQINVMIVHFVSSTNFVCDMSYPRVMNSVVIAIRASVEAGMST
jgi:hypothetical protein